MEKLSPFVNIADYIHALYTNNFLWVYRGQTVPLEKVLVGITSVFTTIARGAHENWEMSIIFLAPKIHALTSRPFASSRHCHSKTPLERIGEGLSEGWLVASLVCSVHLWFWRSMLSSIALFTVNCPHLYYNIIQHVCEAISGNFVVSAQNCLLSTLDHIVMQMRKANREKGFWQLSKQGIRWPVSRDNIAGSGLELIEVACFFDVDCWLGTCFHWIAQARLLLWGRRRGYVYRQNFGAN